MTTCARVSPLRHSEDVPMNPAARPHAGSSSASDPESDPDGILLAFFDVSAAAPAATAAATPATAEDDTDPFDTYTPHAPVSSATKWTPSSECD